MLKKTYYTCKLNLWLMFFFNIIFLFMQKKQFLKKVECQLKTKIDKMKMKIYVLSIS